MPAHHFAYLSQSKWDGSGLYLFHDLKEVGVCRCQSVGDKMRMSIGNDAHPSRDVTRQWFRQHVVGRVTGSHRVFAYG